MPTFERFLDDLDYRLGQKDGARVLFDDTALRQKCVVICEEDDADWEELKAILRKHKQFKTWERKLRAEANTKRKIATIGGDSEIIVNDVWPGAPVHSEAAIPHGWGAGDPKAEIYKLVEKDVDGQSVQRRSLVARAPVVISKRIQDEDRTIRIELSWRVGKHWDRFVYPREVILDSRSLVKTAARGMPVSSVNSAALVDYLQAYESHNLLLIGRGYSTGSMGWKGSREDPTHDGFMCGNRQLGGNGKAFELCVDGDDEDATSISESGTLEAWKNIVAKVVGWPVFRIALAASLAAPLLLPLRAPNMIFELVGPTSRGKTTAMKVMQSAWRSGSFPIQTWNNTVNSFEAKAHLNSDLPLFLDDTKTAVEQGKGIHVAKVIYQFVSGRGRGRAARDGGQRETPSWRSLMISTGEVPASAIAKAEGAATRVLSLWSNPTGVTSEDTASLIDEIEEGLSSAYGQAGPLVIQWLCDHRKDWDELRRRYEKEAKSIREKFSSPAASRLAKVVALLEVANYVGCEAGVLPWKYDHLLDDAEVRRVVEDAIRHAEQASNLAKEAWYDVLSYASARHNQWLPWFEPEDRGREPPGGWLGWSGTNKERRCAEYAWEPSQLKRALKDTGHGDRTEEILRVWRDVGVLDAPEGRLSKAIRCGKILAPENKPLVQRVSLVVGDEAAWNPKSGEDVREKPQPYEPDDEIPF
jgi:Superfamily II helicase and inactivated derivatives